jgi:uncharacterized protein
LIDLPGNHLNAAEEFEPYPWLRNPHIMTIAQALMPRGIGVRWQRVEKLLLQVTPDTSVVAYAHFLKNHEKRPTMILLHGLEGSSESFYILGLTEKALAAGINVIRLNIRNCGGTLHMTPTLYNAGLSSDVLRVIDLLVSEKKLSDLFLVGYSLGGNLVVKATAELGLRSKYVSGTCAISPALDLPVCIDAMERGFNRFYEVFFLASMKRKILKKNKLFPGKFDLSNLKNIKTLRAFDETYTAPDGGYKSGAHYYETASSKPLVKSITTPTLVITAQDDPLVPYESFVGLKTDHFNVLAPKHGGHAAFLQAINKGKEVVSDPFWVDNHIIQFCLAHSKKLKGEE